MTNAVERPESVGMSARRLERVRPAMQAYVDRGVYAGVSTLIARRGKSRALGAVRLARQGGAGADVRRYDLPPLLDDEADRLRRAS